MSELSLPNYDTSTLIRSIHVDIEAPSSLVWDVIVDLDNYPNWNPFCLTARSTLQIGAPVEMVLKDYSGTAETFSYIEYVCAVVPERLLSWELRPTAKSPFAARRDQVIEQLGRDRCRYFSTDAFLGDAAHEIMVASGGWVKRAFDDTAVALKARCESLRIDRAH